MRITAGVNIGHESMSGFIAARGFRSLKPVKYEDIPLPRTGEDRHKLIAGSFERWKKENLVEEAVIGLPLRYFSHQMIEMPAMKRQDLRNALLFELEKYLPLPVDEYVFDFISIPVEPGRPNTMVLAIKKEFVNDLTRRIRESGTRVSSVRCSFLSALRGLLEVSGGRRLSGVFVNMTGDACEICGLKNSLPMYAKSLPKEADLAAEIQKLLALCPGGVYFTGNPPSGLAEKFGGTKFHIQTPRFLALSMVGKNRLDLEFLEAGEEGKGPDYYPYAMGGLIAAAVIIYFLTGAVIYYKDVSALRALETKREQLKSRAAGLLDAKKKNDLLTMDKNTVLDFLGRSNVATRVLSDLSRIVPEGSWLIGMSADDGGKVEIEGFTGKTSSLVMALEKSDAFRNVSYAAPIIAKDGEERFSLKMEVRGLDK
ncbi:MAG: PilN domain-containing protein [Nitrospirae bacterium]|nr:PilN domain-containing protein [Nitrospirota bacterium]